MPSPTHPETGKVSHHLSSGLREMSQEFLGGADKGPWQVNIHLSQQPGWQLWPICWRLNCLQGKSWLVSHLKECLGILTEWDGVQCGCISVSKYWGDLAFILPCSSPFSSLQPSDIFKTEIGLCHYFDESPDSFPWPTRPSRIWPEIFLPVLF